MKVLVVSSMFPNNAQPIYGIFIKNRMVEVGKLCQLRVVSPIPYSPLVGRMKRYAYRSEVAKDLNIGGVEVSYPRHFSIPKFFKPLDGVFFFICLYFFAKKLKRSFDFELIDAHLAYPDGFAAVLLGRLLKVPVAVTLRGHDIFDLPGYPVRRRQVIFALKRAVKVFSVALALKDGAVKLGIPGEKIEVIPNGVDTGKFYHLDKRTARKRLGLPADKEIVLSVGHLVARKGFHHLIEAVQLLRKDYQRPVCLIIIGSAGVEGDSEKSLKKLTGVLGINDLVRFIPAIPNKELVYWYNAADVFCLASSREGMPNVMLEAKACGTPIVATDCWGNSEVLNDPDCGILVKENHPRKIAEAIIEALERKWDPDRISRQTVSWQKVAERVIAEFKNLLAQP